MFLKYKLILFLLLSFNYLPSFAQVNPKAQDTAKMYRKIEKYSKERKFTKFVHKLVFKPVAKQKIKKNSFQKIRKANYAKFEGKIIRNINVTTLDPFGYSEIDTAAKPKNWGNKLGNSLHLKTKTLAIKNLLLIKRNEPLDSLRVKESERLIRSQRFIRRVAITTQSVSKDSVDVNIRVLDSWSLVPDFSASSSKTTFYLSERNFAGTGHVFSNTYTKNLKGPQNGYKTSYTIPNVMNSFINTSVGYSIDFDGNYYKYTSIQRPFYSPYARWAAGVNVDQQLVKPVKIDSNQIATTLNIKYNSQDYWAGHAFRIFKGNTEDERAINLITSLRYFTKTYTDKPLRITDNLGIYTPENLYLFSIGISSRKYTQDKYIFNFDVVEDVESGILYNITTGYQKKNYDYRFYLGGKFGLGKYYEFGYLAGNIEYGTFFQDSKTVQSAINVNLTYFTNLVEAKRWKFRQFIKPQLILGNNRLETDSDRLTLNGGTGIEGFSSTSVIGTKKMLLTFQTQGYSPWRVAGFRLNPFFNFTMGMLGQKDIDFRGSKLYSQFGVGIIISNDFMVFHSFQFSFSYFPNIPLDAGAMFKTNAIRSHDFDLPNFSLAEPMLVPYQ